MVSGPGLPERAFQTKQSLFEKASKQRKKKNKNHRRSKTSLLRHVSMHRLRRMYLYGCIRTQKKKWPLSKLLSIIRSVTPSALQLLREVGGLQGANWILYFKLGPGVPTPRFLRVKSICKYPLCPFV